MPHLDLNADAVTLTEQLVNIESVSLNEEAIADAVETALRPLAHPQGGRPRHTRVARPHRGRGARGGVAGPHATGPRDSGSRK